MADAQGKKLGDLPQGEAQLLRPLDKADPGDHIPGVLPITCCRPLRIREQPSPLVIPDGLDVHPRLGSDFPDGLATLLAWHTR